ncbi:MAG: glycosyltransferase [Planctomycetes bacterium]|nr:glycosyltransferase [Planctomycetota bacterium]
MAARIAVVVDTFPRWSERFIARELNELLRRGVDLTVFAMRKGTLPPGDDPEWQPLLERLRVLPSVPSPKTMASALKAVPNLRRKEARGRLLDVQRELGPAGVVRAAPGHVLGAWCLEGKFTHIYAHFASWPSTLGWLAAHDAGIPLLISVHARDLFVEAQVLEAKIRDARAVFACSKMAFDRVRQVPGGGAKAVLMPHGLPLELFEFTDPAARLGKKNARAELLAAGRFVPKKGFGDLLDALAHPELAKRNLTLTLLGDGPERKALDREVARRGLQDRVQLRPPESGPNLRRLLASASVFVAPYRAADDGDRDGIPNVVLEAFACGTPVAGTDAGGLPEILDDATGRAAASGDAHALAKAIAETLDDPNGASARAKAARARVEERHDIRKSIEPLAKALSV